jgi:2-polyprenyl-3-methyl-5-hydroxy-6-metoxy-1,4-benzoquinol methylase
VSQNRRVEWRVRWLRMRSSSVIWGCRPTCCLPGLLGWDGIAEITAVLRLASGDTLVDLACGRGGYGLEIAARTGARLVGVDFSTEAVRQASEQARRLGSAADFRVGDLAVTGAPTLAGRGPIHVGRGRSAQFRR